MQKFFVSRDKEEARELDFMAAAKLLESTPDEKKKDIPRDIYDLLDKNKTAFVAATTDEVIKPQSRGRDNSTKIIQVLKATLHSTQRFTEDQEAYIARIITQLAEGGLPKQTIKNTWKALQNLKNESLNPFKVLAVLQSNISERLLESHYAEDKSTVLGKREVILSLYLAGE